MKKQLSDEDKDILYTLTKDTPHPKKAGHSNSKSSLRKKLKRLKIVWVKEKKSYQEQETPDNIRQM